MVTSFRSIVPAGPRDQNPPPGPPSGLQKRKHVSTACQSCRTKKLKCTGEQPSCRACIRRNTVCRYVETGVRHASKNYANLQRLQSTQEELLSLMTTLPEQDAVGLLHRLRAGGDPKAIVNHIRDGDLLLQMHLVPETRLRYELPYSHELPERLRLSRSPYLRSSICGVAATTPDERTNSSKSLIDVQVQYHKPYHAATLIEPLLEQARPSEWTTVCADNAVLREILAAYFLNEYHLFPTFHKDYFLEDMAIAQTSHRTAVCCSSLLVNATLAYASDLWLCNKTLPNRYRYWAPDSLGYRFLAEAKRIWELQADTKQHRTLPTIQAATIMNVIYNLYGLDELGNLYGMQSLAIATEMRLFKANNHMTSERLRHASNFTAWCLYNTHCQLSWHFHKPSPPMLADPPDFVLPNPVEQPSWYGEIWFKYPMSSTPSQLHYARYFKAVSEYSAILGKLSQASFSTGSTLREDQKMLFVRQLRAWFQSLPECLQPENIVFPTNILIHLDYHILLMTICDPCAYQSWDNDIDPREIAKDAERDLNILLRLYYLRHSFAGADSWLIAPLSKAGFMSLERINDQTSLQDLEFYRSTLFLSLKGLAEQGCNYYISKTVYHIIRKELRLEEDRLLWGLDDPKMVDERPNSAGVVRSTWVPRIVKVSDDHVAQELSTLVIRFLDLGDSDDRPFEREPHESVSVDVGSCSPPS